ncbi:(Fe-S)-binding protein [Aeoliella sp.]|uniref:(Fe-S)-binding protein n=1 Tax=Aeoliella sp. TaxID=2795800 RepID=UPI003CCC1D81
MNDAMLQTRQIMGNVPAWLVVSFYVAVTLAIVWTCFALVQRIRRYRSSRKVQAGRVPRALADLLKRAFFHRKLMQDPFAGVAHLLVFYGFLVLFWGTCLVFLEHDTPLHFYYGRFYQIASLIIDLGGLAFVTGLLMFIYRRLFGETSRLLKRAYVSALAWLLLAIGISGFLLEGSRIAVDQPAFERWSIVGYFIANGLNTIGVAGDSALRMHRLLWGLHAGLCVAFFALLPWRFFSHMLLGPISWVLRSESPRTSLQVVPLTDPAQNQASPGASSWQELTWLDLVQADACTTCGRCNEVCPAKSAGKPLQPRDVVLGVREAMRSEGALVNSNGGESTISIDDDVIWSCTTCSACNEACPVGIDIYNKIVDLRRGRVEAGAVPTAAVDCFDGTAERYNPFNRPNADRMNWAAGLDVPVAAPDQQIKLLYWVGCSGSFDPDGQGVSRAMTKILNHLGIDYHVLGNRERCTGDPARRMGEEGLFQQLATLNARQLGKHGVVRVLTQCPHCFNSFRNEYPELLDVPFAVEHHSQFLERMIAEGKLSLTAGVQKNTTFHDPCYLGRGNGEVESPRKVLEAINGVNNVEMPRHGRNSFCCGAGGGSLWLDIRGDERIENQRSLEAASTGADTVVTGCPFCKVMLRAGCQTLPDDNMEVLDLAELIVQAEGL